MYLLNVEIIERVNNSYEAMEEYQKCQHLLTEYQKQKLLSATVSQDGSEWCILSGPDLLFDRAGFGPTIGDAVKDYIKPYLIKKQAC